MTTLEYKPSLVFVDDDELILSSLRSLLRKDGYEIHLFTSGENALVFLQNHPAEIIISDMQMPTMSGIDFLNHVSSFSPESFRIMLSGHEDKNIILDALNKGLAQNFILKPWDDTIIRDFISATLKVLNDVRINKLNSILSSFVDVPLTAKFSPILIRFLEKDKITLNEIIIEVENNPTLLTKLMRVANSIFVGSRNKITDIREAIIFIGMDYFTGLIVSIEVYHNIVKGQTKEIELLMDTLWTESLHRAHIAKLIAGQKPDFPDPHLLYIASLLQDIGLIVQIASAPEQYKRFLSLSSIDGCNEYAIEQKIFSITHDRVGKLLLSFWNFPSIIIESIEQHHAINIAGNTFVELMQISTILASPKKQIQHDESLNQHIEFWQNQLSQIILNPASVETI